MSIYAPDPSMAKLRGAILASLFLSVIALGFLGTGLALGTEPRLVLERSGPGTFRVTGSSYFAGYQYFTKTIDGVTSVAVGSAARDWRSDSLQERHFVKAGVNDPAGGDARVAHIPVVATLPGRGFLPLKIAIDEHIEPLAIALEERAIFGRESQVERRRDRLRGKE